MSCATLQQSKMFLPEDGIRNIEDQTACAWSFQRLKVISKEGGVRQLEINVLKVVRTEGF